MPGLSGPAQGFKEGRSWDARAWAQARPDKVVPTDGAAMTDEWVTELRDLGYRDAEPTLLSEVMGRPGELDRGKAVTTILNRLGAKRSGWNAADIRGEAERLIARENIVTDKPVRIELAEDPAYVHYRKAVIDFLYTRQGHVEKAA